MSREIHIHMNSKTLGAMSKMHDVLLYGAESLARTTLNIARSDEKTTHINMFGQYGFRDESLNDGEVEFYDDNKRIKFFKISIDNNPFFEVDLVQDEETNNDIKEIIRETKEFLADMERTSEEVKLESTEEEKS